MKKRYTKRQIQESIKYWQKQLKRMNEDSDTLKPFKVGDIVWDTYEGEKLEPVKIVKVTPKYTEWNGHRVITDYKYECNTLDLSTTYLSHYGLEPLKLKH